MSRFQKAHTRLKTKLKDFTWAELQTIMKHLGHEEQKGSGSRRKFVHTQTKTLISLHEPHPNPIIKSYALEIVIEHLKEHGLL